MPTTKKYTILYIDDEPHNLRTFKATFKWDYDILTAQSAFEGFDILEKNEVQLIISDQRMAGLSGTEFFKKVVKRFPEPMRIILTGYSELDTIIRAINDCGIYRYMTKPWKESDIKKTIEDTLEVYQLRKDKERLLEELSKANKKLSAENSYLKEEIQQQQSTSFIISKNKPFQKKLALIQRVGPTNSTVLIRGETGTGKELMARAIHEASPRKDKVLIKVNCAALPANLIESELFGHERGAFTGATQKRIGRFELADGGSIFLDEIGELPIDLQPKLLRALQEGTIDRVGGTQTIKVDVRIIAATNRNLEEEITKGQFREDLFYRLNVFPIYCPPLRERKEDIELLVRHFLKKHEAKIGRKIQEVSPETIAKLSEYNFPGNIRELENLIERFMIISTGNSLELSGWLPVQKELPSSNDHFLTMEEMEIHHIKSALRLSKGKVFGSHGAAEMLGMNGKTLDSRIRKLKIDKEDI